MPTILVALSGPDRWAAAQFVGQAGYRGLFTPVDRGREWIGVVARCREDTVDHDMLMGQSMSASSRWVRVISASVERWARETRTRRVRCGSASAATASA